MPVSCIPQFIDECEQALAAAFPEVQVVCFGHVGDGNLHYNISPREGDNTAFLANTEAVNRIVHDRVCALGGSISAEHGIGQLKRAELRHYKSAIEIELMQRVRDAIDPKSVCNPDKIL